MGIFSLFIQVGILWFLITLFTGSRNSSQSLRETWIVIIGMMIIGILSRLLLGGILGPLLILVDIVTLYFLVDKVCEESQKTTIKICAWYFGLSLLIGLAFSVLAS